MNARLLAAAAAALFIVACGSNDKKTTPGTPSATYAGPTGPAALGASTDKSALIGAAAGMAEALSTSSDRAMAYGVGGAPKPMSVKQVLAMAADVYHRPPVADASGAVVPTTTPCPAGGSFTVTVSHQNANPAVTTNGDYVDVAFAGCTQGTMVTEGSFRFTIDQTAGDDFVMSPASITTDRSFGLTISYDSLLLRDTQEGFWVGVDGDIGVAFAATVSTGTITYGIAGTHFDEAFGVADQIAAGVRLAPLSGQAKYHDTAVERYTGLGTAGAALVDVSWDLDARLCTTEIGGCVNVETNPVFLFADDPATTHPSSGALTVSDDAGDWVRATATNGTTGACTISWHVDGADGSMSTFWDAL